MESEQLQYETIKELADHGGNKNRAAKKLGCSRRSIDRHIAGYRSEGKGYFIHGNSGRKPTHALSDEMKSEIVRLYKESYYDASFNHFTELINKRMCMALSNSTVRNILSAADILSPKATRKTKRAHKARMAQLAAVAPSSKEEAALTAVTVAMADAHPRRPRRANFGEMIQMDASLHPWFYGIKSTLHMAVDDATGRIVGAWFDKEETLDGYYHVLWQVLVKYGIPYMFYTDRRTVFEYKRRNSADDSGDTFTQFSYACSQLGIEIKTTSVPQAKGRIERLNGSVQGRLPVELRLGGVSSIEQANDYLPRFIEEYNASFALDIDPTRTVFETSPSLETIDRTLAVVTRRSVDNGHSIRLNNKHYRTLDKNGMPIYFYKGTKGLAIRTFSGNLYFCTDDRVSALEEIPVAELASRNFDFKPAERKPVSRYVPPPSHPWRRAAFAAHVKKQARLAGPAA